MRNLQIAITIVAVVRPLRLNHVSEYLGPMTWYIGCAIEAKNCERTLYINSEKSTSKYRLTWPIIKRA